MKRIANRDYINTQQHQECSLISLINMHLYHTGRKLAHSRELYYKTLVKKYCCEVGACIGIDKLYKALGYTFSNYSADKSISVYALPVECIVYHKKRGIHSVAVIKHVKKGENSYLLVPNLGQEDNSLWVRKEEFEEMLHPIRTGGSANFGCEWCQRLVRLEGN